MTDYMHLYEDDGSLEEYVDQIQDFLRKEPPEGPFNYEEHVEKLVEDHTSYQRELLESLDQHSTTAKAYLFAYRTAAHHFIRHGVEIADLYGITMEDIR